MTLQDNEAGVQAPCVADGRGGTSCRGGAEVRHGTTGPDGHRG
jgi:hypothetical protein